MLDDNPVLKERLMAVGAFAGIAVFAIAAVNFIISGGFDFGATRAPYDREQPSAYVHVVDAAQYVSDRVQRISWDDTFSVDEAEAATTVELVGAGDGSLPPDATTQTSDEELLQAVAQLYAEQPSEAQSYADEAYVDEYPLADEEENMASASENASPW